MKKILGLDLGSTSIGWAFVKESENENEKSEIVKLGVRVVPLTTDEETDFERGNPISVNAERTLKRGARRNLDRYQIRREALIEILKQNGFIEDGTVLSEDGKHTTFEKYRIRAKAAKEKISKEEFARTLLMINKKRGYKSSRKTKQEDEGTAIDGMEVAKYIYDNDLTPGQYVYDLLKKGKKHLPDFYRSDLQAELNKIWEFQKEFYPEIFTDEFKEQISGKGKQAISKMFLEKYGIYTAENKGKRDEVRLQAYKWRSEAIVKQLLKEELAYVIVEINNNINSSSGYLGAISDRSKELCFKSQTVGEYLYQQLRNNSHTRLKNQVFYRQDYLDEFEKIWEVQNAFYPELTKELKREIRDVVIFYQRRLKSQKHLISKCEFEKNHRVVPRSSPLFQEFKIRQTINNLRLRHIDSGEVFGIDVFDDTIGEQLFEELNIRHKLKDKEILKILVKNPKEYELNYETLEGNETNAALYDVYAKILEFEGELVDFKKLNASQINDFVSTKLLELGIEPGILTFEGELEGDMFDKQPLMQLWHLLYSFEGDNSVTGNKKLIEKIKEKFGFPDSYARMIANISLKPDYGSLSSRAIKKILPYLKERNTYDMACYYAGYNHSSSLTKEELESRGLKDKLDLLKKNSLRNPVVEKILNQMVNVINAIIDDENLGKPDEIRIELARELKYSADERKRMTANISKATREYEGIRKILQNEFGVKKVTRNDIIRYRLWKELESNGFKTLYTNTYIPKEKVFSKEFDIEHIIPQAKLFDDSFSNKTLSVRHINIEKGNKTAYDYLKEKLSTEDFEQYKARIDKLYKNSVLTRAKYNKLLMKEKEIPDGFIERDLRNSQYIAKKAVQMLSEVVRSVTTTTGKITDRLRSDWQLINVLKELNLPKYEKLGMVKVIEGKDGKPERQIVDWTKRNDHRHHAMDALTVAFTTRSHVQYLNFMNARNNEMHKKYHEVYGIEKKQMHRDKNGKLIFISPVPVSKFRTEAKKHLESILVSFKAKNKVATRNRNKIKIKGGFKEKIELTPRGQLHKETVYGKIYRYATKLEKVGSKFNEETIGKVADKKYRQALLKRLNDFNGNTAKAFGGKNSLSKNPVFTESNVKVPEKVKLVWQKPVYIIRKKISPDLFRNSKKEDIFHKKIEDENFIIDNKIREILKTQYDKAKKEVKEYNQTVEKKNQKKALETALSDLEGNPIWLDKEKGICIKRVTITGVSNAEPLHYKKDHNGKLILDTDGEKQPVDFVSTGNNHHVAIYRDAKGNLQEKVVSFFEAVERKRQGLSVIDKSFKSDEDWEFLFSMKQNEYFVFPSDDFDPNEVDLHNPKNLSMISPNLYRVQKIASTNYMFRHHLETTVEEKKELKNISHINIRTPKGLCDIVKVRLNHLGRIVSVGEY